MESKDLEVINGTGKTPFQEWAEKYKNGQINMQASASTENMIAFARSIPVPTAREQHEMAVKAKLGDREARDLLILASLRLGIIVAQQMELNLKNNIEDYIQNAVFSTTEAIQRYDPDRDTKFSTYLYRVMQWSMLNVHDNTGKKYGKYSVECNTRLHKELKKYADANEPIPSISQLAKTLHMTPETVRGLLSASEQSISLDQTIDQGDGGTPLTREAVTPDEKSEEAFRKTEEHEQYLYLKGMFDNFPEKYREVLNLRYGLTGDEPMTQEETALSLGITRRRVGQIEDAALRRLRKEAGIEKYPSTKEKIVKLRAKKTDAEGRPIKRKPKKI